MDRRSEFEMRIASRALVDEYHLTIPAFAIDDVLHFSSKPRLSRKVVKGSIGCE
jgi:hypothetical protein